MNFTDYDFELPQIFDFLAGKASAALEFPEGLLQFAYQICSTIEQQFPDLLLLIHADVAYGACCVDYSLMEELGIACVVHFGHSELLPTRIPTYYAKCNRRDFDEARVAEAITAFCSDHGYTRPAIAATAQTCEFANTLHLVSHKFKPLTDCEMLGCTAAHYSNVDCILSLADGLFHAEALKAMNRTTPVYGVDPRSGAITLAGDEIIAKIEERERQLEELRCQNYRTVCFVLGTLGGQGSISQLYRLRELALVRGYRVRNMVVPEVYPAALNFPGVDFYVQLACPRLTLDWYECFANCLSAEEFDSLENGDIEELLCNYTGETRGGHGCHMDTWASE